jgi:tRNA CCA-adding enzyme
MAKKHDSVLENILENINPKKEEMEKMELILNNFKKKLNSKIKKLNIDAEIFLGGSFAKNTLIKKNIYDADLFLRFNSKYPQSDYTKLTKKILKGIKKVSKIHGSRDYFRIKVNSNFFFEIIPVKKVKHSREAENITDLSYSHVKYIKKKIKSKKTIDGIKLAKAFCYATKTYGAESYVHGFSGYSLELLIHNYGGFIEMLKALTKKINEKIIVDIEKSYKKKQDVMLDLNSSKLDSPIILIDPTFKGRNALAALSDETFEKFQEKAKEFLSKPQAEIFERKSTNLNNLKKNAKKKKIEFIVIKTKTKRQEGDIAGTKLLKFHRHLFNELEKYFKISDSGFDYLGKKEGQSYFVLKKKKFVLFCGPPVDSRKNVLKFKNEHAKTFIEDGKVCAKEKIIFDSKGFFKFWTKKYKRKIKEMYVSSLKVFD